MRSQGVMKLRNGFTVARGDSQITRWIQIT
jgi:hypothetical protein